MPAFRASSPPAFFHAEPSRYFLALMHTATITPVSVPSGRKFYKTIVSFEVLSEEPIGEMSLGDVLVECAVGSFSGRPLDPVEAVLTGPEAADALKEQGSDPGFFNLTPDGQDAD